jgi:hypothetical protein
VVADLRLSQVALLLLNKLQFTDIIATSANATTPAPAATEPTADDQGFDL